MMGFFSGLSTIAMESVGKLVENEEFYNSSFSVLLKYLYESKQMDSTYKRYASCVVLIKKYCFYDPYISKIVKGDIWKLRKADLYNTTNVRNSLVEKFKGDLQNYDKEKLLDIIELYKKQQVSIYRYNGSRYYYTFNQGDCEFNNHYACKAAVELLKEKYREDIYFEDLSDENDEDLREKKYQERVEKATNAALKGLAYVASYYSDDTKENNVEE